MTFVLDASVTLNWVFPDEATDATARLRDALDGGRAFVPALWPIEVGNALVAAVRRGRVTSDDRRRIAACLGGLPIEVDPLLPSRVWVAAADLAEEHDLSVYDAMYLELALRMRLPLATADRRLAAAARSGGLEALPSA